MKSVEDRLNEVRLPDIRLESHRTQLGYRLQRPAAARTLRYRRPALAWAVSALILLGGLTAIRPTWATELLRLVLVRETVATTQHGDRMITRTYQSAPGTNATGGSVQLQTDASGRIVSESTQPQADPALQAMHVEAQSQVRSGQAQLILDQDNTRSYRVTLRDGRRIVYTEGPGTSWSISTN
jgi:hypothetical protein